MILVPEIWDFFYVAIPLYVARSTDPSCGSLIDLFWVDCIVTVVVPSPPVPIPHLLQHEKLLQCTPLPISFQFSHLRL